jgi:predicted HicB family RNase H-like nuclease
MADIPSPQRPNSKGFPPRRDEARNRLNLRDTVELMPLNFKVDPAFHREFKIYAARAGLSMKELLDRCFREYQARHPVRD